MCDVLTQAKGNWVARLRRPMVRRLVRGLFVGGVLIALGMTIAGQWAAVRPHLDRLSVGGIAGAMFVLLLAIFTSMLSWRSLLADLGSPLPLSTAARIFMVGQLGKYLPGSVWVLLAQMELARDYGVPRQRSGTAVILLYPINVVTGTLIGALALPFAGRQDVSLLLTVPIFIAAVAVLHPVVLSAVMNPLLRLVRREPLERLPTLRGMLKAGAWTGVTFALSGTHVWILAADLGARQLSASVLSIGAWAIAWCVGFLLVIFPGGFGPREFVLAQIMSPVLSGTAAMVLVVVSRLVFTVAELVWASAVALADRGPMHVRR